MYKCTSRSLLETPFFYLMFYYSTYIPEKNNTVVTVSLSEGYF